MALSQNIWNGITEENYFVEPCLSPVTKGIGVGSRGGVTFLVAEFVTDARVLSQSVKTYSYCKNCLDPFPLCLRHLQKQIIRRIFIDLTLSLSWPIRQNKCKKHSFQFLGKKQFVNVSQRWGKKWKCVFTQVHHDQIKGRSNSWSQN